MKRVGLLLLLVAISIGLVACGSSGSSSSGSTSEESTGESTAASEEAATGGGGSVSVILGVKGFAYYTALGCGAEAEGEKLGLDVSVQGGSEFSPTAQIPIVNSVTAQHPDAAIVAPTDQKALVAPLKQMEAAGIKLIEADTATDPPLGETQITSNNAEAGVLGAETLAKAMGEKGEVMILSTAPGVSTEDARIKAFTETIEEEYPEIKIMSPQYDGANPEKATSVTSGVLSAHPELGGIFTTNLLSTEGVETAIKQAHKQESVKFVGSDGAQQELNDLKSGVMQGIILQKPFEEGQIAVREAQKAINGEPVEAPQETGIVALTKENLAEDEKYIYQESCE